MTTKTQKETYTVQAEVSRGAQAALYKEQGRRQVEEGKKIRMPDLVAEIIERWAKEPA